MQVVAKNSTSGSLLKGNLLKKTCYPPDYIGQWLKI